MVPILWSAISLDTYKLIKLKIDIHYQLDYENAYLIIFQKKYTHFSQWTFEVQKYGLVNRLEW
jgi:hypothetical protein